MSCVRNLTRCAGSMLSHCKPRISFALCTTASLLAVRTLSASNRQQQEPLKGRALNFSTFAKAQEAFDAIKETLEKVKETPTMAHMDAVEDSFKKLLSIAEADDLLDKVDQELTRITLEVKKDSNPTSLLLESTLDSMWIELASAYFKGNYTEKAEITLLNAPFFRLNGVANSLFRIVNEYLKINKYERAVILLQSTKFKYRCDDEYGANAIYDPISHEIIKYLFDRNKFEEGIKYAEILLPCAFDRGEFLQREAEKLVEEKKFPEAILLAEAIPNAAFLTTIYPRKILEDVPLSRNRDETYAMIASACRKKDLALELAGKIEEESLRKEIINKIVK